MIRGVLVRQADGSLQWIGFYVNDAGLADVSTAQQLVTRVIASVREGARLLPSGGQLTLGRLTLDVPAGYTAYAQHGPDFTVYWVEHLVPLMDEAGHLYVGDHPARPSAPANAQYRIAMLFGIDAIWRVWRQAGGVGEPGVLRQEAFVRHHREVVHAFIASVSEPERAALPEDLGDGDLALRMGRCGGPKSPDPARRGRWLN